MKFLFSVLYFVYHPIGGWFWNCPRIVLRMRNVSDTNCRENQQTHILCSITFSSKNRAVYEIMCKNLVELGRPQIIWRMRIACWVTKATDTPSEYVIFIAFPQQQWLRERAPMLRCIYSVVFRSPSRPKPRCYPVTPLPLPCTPLPVHESPVSLPFDSVILLWSTDVIVM